MQNFHIIYPDYHYKITPSIVGALELIPKSLDGYVYQLAFNNMEAKINNTKIEINFIYWHSKNMEKFPEIWIVCSETNLQD